MKIPHYADGADKYLTFVDRLAPLLLQGLTKRGVTNPNALDYTLRQLAFESAYGTSRVARQLHNYGGYGWNGKTYTTFKDDQAFIDKYLDLITSRYKDAINSPTIEGFATNLKKLGYYEAPLDGYTKGLRSMNRVTNALLSYTQNYPQTLELLDMTTFTRPIIPDLKSVLDQQIAAQKSKLLAYNIPKDNTPSVDFEDLPSLNIEDYAFSFNSPRMSMPHYEDGKDTVEKRLPEITITPEPGSTERIFAAKQMIPNKDLRHAWYDDIMLYGDPAGQIERTYRLWNMAGKPGIYPYSPFGAQSDRSYYKRHLDGFLGDVLRVLSPIYSPLLRERGPNTIHLLRASHLEDELAHAVQINKNILPGEDTRKSHPEWDELKHYTTGGSTEYNAHSVIEPILKKYTRGKIDGKKALKLLLPRQNK